MPASPSALPRARTVLLGLLAALLWSATTAHGSTGPAIYFDRCLTIYRCELRRTDETLTGSEPVPNVPDWHNGCGDLGAINCGVRVSADGSTAVVLSDVSSHPGGFGDKEIFRLIVTDIRTGQTRTLPTSISHEAERHRWFLSPDGQEIAILARSGLYVQSLTAGSRPKLLHTGFTPEAAAWYPDGSRLLVAGPSSPLGGRGPVGTENRLFEFTASGRLLGWWLMRPYPAYLVSTHQIVVTSNGRVFVAAWGDADPSFGGTQASLPEGHYSVRLVGHTARLRLLRREGGGGPLSLFGADAATNTMFIAAGEKGICAVNINTRTTHCARLTTEVHEVQVAPAVG